ncbi:hypothetical protein GCM10022279_02390 [Comamonas faecalis]|uniref:Flagellar assembly protein FliH n=1 Tax=Comamonas faecalis TaxID=1387849 RepID=A0ABP7QGW6_9BURK
MSNSSTRYYTRFIPSEEIAEVTRWEFGAVGTGGDAGLGGPVITPPEPQPMPEPEPVAEAAPPAISDAQLQQLLAQARAQGHADGLAEGIAQAEQQWRQRLDDHVAGQGRESAQQLAQLVQQLEESFAGLQQRMAGDLLDLALDIARQVVRQQVQGNPQAVLPVVREALDMLVGESRPAAVRLNPQDWEVLEPALRAQFGGSRIQWLADAEVAPGDCHVESAGMRIDGTLAQRWRRAIAALGLSSVWKEAGNGH